MLRRGQVKVDRVVVVAGPISKPERHRIPRAVAGSSAGHIVVSQTNGNTRTPDIIVVFESGAGCRLSIALKILSPVAGRKKVRDIRAIEQKVLSVPQAVLSEGQAPQKTGRNLIH